MAKTGQNPNLGVKSAKNGQKRDLGGGKKCQKRVKSAKNGHFCDLGGGKNDPPRGGSDFPPFWGLNRW